MRWDLTIIGAVGVFALVGCSPTAPTGTVSVEIGADADSRMGARFAVALTGSDGSAVVEKMMVRGENRTFSDIPLGDVTIEIGRACLFHTVLTTAGAAVAVHEMNCSIG